MLFFWILSKLGGGALPTFLSPLFKVICTKSKRTAPFPWENVLSMIGTLMFELRDQFDLCEVHGQAQAIT